MGSKHGQWFLLEKHLSIHSTVLQSFDWLIKEGDRKYQIDFEVQSNKKYITHLAKFKTQNDFLIKIEKVTLLSSENSPKYGKTDSFSYNCIGKNGYKLQYHSPHSYVFNLEAPWHHEYHRHEIIGKVQKIDVYSEDVRNEDERKRKLTWGIEKQKVELNYLNHQEWPFIKEFLDEVSSLP